MRKLDSWDILLMFYKHKLAFVGIFVAVLCVGLALFFATHRDSPSGDSLGGDLAGKDSPNAVAKQEIQAPPSKKIFVLEVISKSVKGTPIINAQILGGIFANDMAANGANMGGGACA